MTIKYTLHQNHLPTGANSYRARVDYQQVIEGAVIWVQLESNYLSLKFALLKTE